jgi:uncharacterized protein (UPF0335 family)
MDKAQPSAGNHRASKFLVATSLIPISHWSASGLAQALNRAARRVSLSSNVSDSHRGIVEGTVENGSVPASSVSAATLPARDQLRSFVERIERLEEEKAALAGDIRDLFLQAKSSGFDTKALRTVIRLRKQDAAERRDQEAVLATYMLALGMLEGEQ